ncbi:GRB10-interacting GYF protein 2 isoform X1 [Odocoileus virginianus]|uniref:GRB10-interacting GYF protein 2 isoform X1 n=2 Tax=Odocoileus virginianus TaxID=9874 RepID=A0A6J0XKS0_ODOVR|nr:GRB10-interacting GYF protein 2 isoform X1 [Odocoileus virginianus texanus]XP_020749581.1 GRB10-interacting GYF protein 2 isoform X1 [Odocoileus virginianus texanus]XP_020749582.1 GRB10-interacting GYF protein 2 isoform X1 [Odocoileus virginianus texanus]XP_020749583.1 GRB10-interacting GYF protein 2 isoform X1 [Odocoileus virginianus texanus]
MAAETQTLNFGPEWLRALSSGGSITSPPLSPALPKYKLADYRYGREEMLALFLKDNKIPSDLLDKEFLPILQEEPLLPLALVPFTEEEQRNFSMSVNSAAVLRLTGRGGGGTVVGAPRGRSSSRGRGRGRGECGFYQRSFDEVEGVFGRGGSREMHRSQSWEERGDRRFEKPGRKDVGRPNFEEGGPVSVGRKHEFIRSESENWRIFREEQNGEDEDGGWRLAGSRRDGERWRPHSPDGPRSAGWREHMERRRRFEFDFRDRDDERGYRRVRSGSGSIDDDRDSLPEWCLEDAEEEMGTFDSSGAFLSLKKVQKEPIPEEQEMDFRPVEEGEECSDSEGSHNEEAKEPDKTNKKEAEKTDRVGVEASEETPQTSSSSARPGSPSDQPQEAPQFERKEESKTEQMEKAEEESRTDNSLSTKVSSRGDEMVPDVQQPLSQIPSDTASPLLILPPPVPNPSPVLRPVETPVVGAPGMGSVSTEPDDEEGLKHLEQQAEKMVAYLQDSALDDERLASKLQEHRAKGVSIPLMHEAMQKWYYKDPQGEIQGPFNNQEMAEWFQAGYFTMSLLVKRACDESFQPLGDIMKMWGRVPFSPGPAPPPHMGELDQERLTRQQELTALYQMQHLQYQQFLIQQQYAQVLAQQQKAALSSQQQQQLALLLQQFQALKMRISDQNIIPSVTRSVSVPDTGSIWELQPAPSQPTVWEGGSVWDLPLDPATPGPALEQLQQMEKAKAAKLEQERREAEMRAKREEEERKRQEELRRQQEEILRRQQEEERKRREEEELARRKQEEALRRQREQEIALRRQREEEERQQQEEALRRLEERRREEEERRKQEELLRKQEEEAAKWAREEEEAQRRLEESRLRMEEEAARLRHEEEERKRKELELQRQKELLRQRQQQQEALRRLQQQQQQQQLAQMKLPSSSTWGQQSNTTACQSQATLSLAEIQKLEEERERQLREEQRRQQRELMKALQQQQQQQQQKLSGWGNVSKPAGTAKSLLEIQQEEARQMQKQQQQQQQHQQPNRARSNTHSNLHTSIGNSVWGSINTGPPNQWASDLVSSIWSNADTKNSNMGFWDDAVKEVGPRNSTNKNKNAGLSKSVGVSNRQNKKVEEEEKLLKLFQGVNKAQDGFTQWCEQMLHALNTANNLDVPTFVSFLKEVESPYEVHDYIRAYLGDTSEAKEFAKQFLERRAKQKANQRQQQQQQQQQQQDSVWGMNHSALHSVFQTNQTNNQQSNFEAVQSGKKKKKQKMVRADPSLLGFSVNASSERLNMGEIETLDDY